MKTAVFTIISLNYGSYAKTLMESVMSVHPEWDRHVLVVDKRDGLATFGGEKFVVTPVEELPLPRLTEFLFRYDVMELNTAVKPYMFSHLRRLGYDRVVYLDPDILVFDRLIGVERLLDEGATAVVIPHLTAPIDDGRAPSELDIMRAGAYNLGFLAVGNLPASDAFIRWWADKLEHGAACDQERGLFTDQKWVDLAPGMFGGFAVLRDPGYNVAYWNLLQRPIRRKGDIWFAGPEPLRFFHFSGFDPLNPQPFSKYQNRLTLSTIGEARELALEYAERVLSHGFAESTKTPYTFGSFTDGTPIPSAIRALYREDPNVRLQVGKNPFEQAEYFLFSEDGGLPIILRALWLKNGRLQRAFPDPLGASRPAYYNWFIEGGGTAVGIPEAFILPVRRAFRFLRIAEANGFAKTSVWARGLVFVHKLVVGRAPSVPRVMQYHQVTGPIAFLRVGLKQFRSSHWAERIGVRSRGANEDPLTSTGAYFGTSSRDTRSVFNAARQTALKSSSALSFPAVNVIGYARSEHGIGQSLRQFTAALDSGAIPNVIIDFNINNSSRIGDYSLDNRIVEEPVHGINVFHINADQMPEAEMHLPKHFFSRYNIGFWHWELPEMLDEHVAGFNTLDEVWVPSGFVQDAVAKRSPLPVVRMPHAIAFTASPAASRASFALPEDKFLFLMMYDFSSYQERKNPQAALDAFFQAFTRQNSKVALVIKTQNAHFHDLDAALIRDRVAGHKDVIWINETLTRQQAYDLQFVCDAFVSLHRSEGFGLGPAEAMFLGKPVIATNWSGNTEFMHPQNSLPVNYTLVKIEKDVGVYRAGQTWADPDVGHAASLMRQIVDDQGLRRRISAEAQRTMREEYSPSIIAQRIRARLDYIQAASSNGRLRNSPSSLSLT